MTYKLNVTLWFKTKKPETARRCFSLFCETYEIVPIDIFEEKHDEKGNYLISFSNIIKMKEWGGSCILYVFILPKIQLLSLCNRIFARTI